MTIVAIRDLRQRVALQHLLAAPDGAGGEIREWETLAELWAAVTPITGTEHASADVIATRLTHRVRVRYRADLAAGMRFLAGSRAFQIEAVLDAGPREPIACLCRETPP